MMFLSHLLVKELKIVDTFLNKIDSVRWEYVCKYFKGNYNCRAYTGHSSMMVTNADEPIPRTNISRNCRINVFRVKFGFEIIEFKNPPNARAFD